MLEITARYGIYGTHIPTRHALFVTFAVLEYRPALVADCNQGSRVLESLASRILGS